eukprot:3584838-Lingulodinium_polyedra.AAC.1
MARLFRSFRIVEAEIDVDIALAWHLHAGKNEEALDEHDEVIAMEQAVVEQAAVEQAAVEQA